MIEWPQIIARLDQGPGNKEIDAMAAIVKEGLEAGALVFADLSPLIQEYRNARKL